MISGGTTDIETYEGRPNWNLARNLGGQLPVKLGLFHVFGVWVRSLKTETKDATYFAIRPVITLPAG